MTKQKCEKCGAKMVPVVYGLPSSQMFEKAERGDIYLGGCVIWPDNPKFRCMCEEEGGEG